MATSPIILPLINAPISQWSPGIRPQALENTQYGAHKVDGFVRKHGRQIREITMAVASALAPTQPGIAAGVATFGQGAASYRALRDAIDRAAAS